MIKITYCGESAIPGHRRGYWAVSIVRGRRRHPDLGGSVSGIWLPRIVPAMSDHNSIMPPYESDVRKELDVHLVRDGGARIRPDDSRRQPPSRRISLRWVS